jgi:hypothetical protein
MCVQDDFNNRIASANVSCTLYYYGGAGEQLPGLSDVCNPAEGDDSELTTAIYATAVGIYEIKVHLGQPGFSEVVLTGEDLISLLWRTQFREFHAQSVGQTRFCMLRIWYLMESTCNSTSRPLPDLCQRNLVRGGRNLVFVP